MESTESVFSFSRGGKVKYDDEKEGGDGEEDNSKEIFGDDKDIEDNLKELINTVIKEIV